MHSLQGGLGGAIEERASSFLPHSFVTNFLDFLHARPVGEDESIRPDGMDPQGARAACCVNCAEGLCRARRKRTTVHNISDRVDPRGRA